MPIRKPFRLSNLDSPEIVVGTFALAGVVKCMYNPETATPINNPSAK